ncbi:MAG: glycoside hydrolase family 57 protein [Bryobacteraceae bacterium]
MPKINICFLWHMHQPFYKDLVTGEYRLPWTRLHAFKDYYGMVKILEDFPDIHQTFNLVPSLLVQIEEYAAGKASDPFWTLALKPAEQLEAPEKEFILRYFFQANEERQIGRYPRYTELFRVLKQCQQVPGRAVSLFDSQMLRDLQVLSQLAWTDEEYLQKDAEIRGLANKGRNYSQEDQALLGRKQLQALGKVVPVYQEFAGRGQIEISTTPYYHPILPLLCDSNIGAVSHPYIPLPLRFSYPGDAEEQLARARAYVGSKLDNVPLGLWPSEGSVSDQTLEIASRLRFRWTASDNGVLARTLNAAVTPADTYQPYLWRQGEQEIRVLFRDHQLSDLIGFVYSRMDAREAAGHFLAEIRKNCGPLLKQGRDAVVPIILDGENAWEYYFENGRPFLRELYSRITSEPDMAALTMSEAIEAMPARELTHIFPGSWIDASFDIWIGAEEDNRAWEHLLSARNAYDQALKSPRSGSIPQEAQRLAWEEILIAEGSDWCWWYGPEHSSANKAEFDQLYRNHLGNVYMLLGEEVPPGLNESILKGRETGLHEPPSGLIQPEIDGVVSSHLEWSGAGHYRIDHRSGAMHSRRSLIQELLYGSDGQNIYLRVDLTDPIANSAPLDFRLHLRNQAGEQFQVNLRGTNPTAFRIDSNLPESAVTAALLDIYEVRISMSALHVRRGDPVFLQIWIFRDELLVACLPVNGELELESSGMCAAYAG